MGFFKSKKGSIISDYFSIETDLGQFKKGNAVDVALFPDHLELQNASGNKKTATLAYSQITDIFYGSKTQLQLKEKSPIARAFAGGLLFGSTGAFVGALSGLGKKEKKVRRILFIISYVTADGQEAFLPFEDTRLYKGAEGGCQAARALRHRARAKAGGCSVRDQAVTRSSSRFLSSQCENPRCKLHRGFFR